MFRTIPIATAFAALLLGGAVHGIWTDRWKWSDELEKSAARLSQVPMTAGEWQGEDEEDRSTPVTGVAGSLYRRYTNRAGQVVTVFMVCGRPGPVAIHTPSDCYVAAGYEMLSQVRVNCPAGQGSPDAVLWTAQFRKTQSTDQTFLRIFWSWSATGAWQAPDDPRFDFGRRRYPALYKMYVLREMASLDEPLETDPCQDLLKQLLPAMRGPLFGQ